MTMQIKPDEITSILKSRIEGLDAGQAELTEVGTVLSIGDGIARIHGLENCMAFETLEFPHDVTGLALNLESDNVGAVLFGEWDKIVEGDTVKRTNRLLEIPVGDGLLGRIVDPLGNPLDGKGEIEFTETRPAEFKAPGVVQRQPVTEPMQTGIKAIDSMIPIGRGQRELIIGDRQTGKTTIGIDTIINNKDSGVVSIYVAIGQRMATVVQLAETLAEAGALENTIIVAASADEAAPIKFLAPYAGCAMGEYFLYKGGHALCIYDDLTKHALRLPADVAAAAPPAGPRGVPGRRLLPAQPPARARGQAQRRPRRRLADRAADHRDAGRRRVGLHPDERHLDHRRADLPRAQAVLLGRAPGHQRRHLGVARGRQRADLADEEGRRPPEDRAVAVPRPRGVRPVRLRPRRRDAEDAGPRRAPGQGAQPERALAAAGRRPGRPGLRRHQRLPRPHQRRPRRRVPRRPRRSACAPRPSDLLEKIAGGDWSDDDAGARSRRSSPTFAEDFGYDLDEEGQPLRGRRRQAALAARGRAKRRRPTARRRVRATTSDDDESDETEESERDEETATA